MSLLVQNLSKTFDRKIAVNNISFEINEGETIGILGPNGAGKTTLFYMIAGLVGIDNGHITLSGEELNRKSISERTRLGLTYLPQESSIFKRLSVEQNIFAALEQRKGLNKKEREKKLLELQL